MFLLSNLRSDIREINKGIRPEPYLKFLNEKIHAWVNYAGDNKYHVYILYITLYSNITHMYNTRIFTNSVRYLDAEFKNGTVVHD